MSRVSAGTAGRSEPAEQLVAWAEADHAAPLLVLEGTSCSGREDVLALAAGAWAGQGLTVLTGRAGMAPADTVAVAAYDAVIRSPRASVLLNDAAAGIPGGDDGAIATRAWADLVRSAAGPRPLVLVLHEVELARPEAVEFATGLAARLAAGIPRGRLVINPTGPLPPQAAAFPVLTCPPAKAPGYLLERDGGERSMHPQLRQALESVTGERQTMLEVLRAWRGQEKVRLIDHVWMPGADLAAPALALSRPALAALRGLSEHGLAVLAAIAVLAPCRPEQVLAALRGPSSDTGQPAFEACLEDLRARGLIRGEGPDGLAVVSELVRASAAASIGPARQEVWRVRAASQGYRVPATRGRPRGAVLSGAVLSGAVTRGAPTSGAVLSGAVTRGAPTSGAVLSGAVTRGAPTPGAVLSGAVTRGAVTRGGVMSGAVMSGAENRCVPAGSRGPADGERTIDAARWALAQERAADLPALAARAALVLAWRGRVDRARAWLEQAVSAPPAPSLPATCPERGPGPGPIGEQGWLSRAEAEVGLLEGGPDARRAAADRAATPSPDPCLTAASGAGDGAAASGAGDGAAASGAGDGAAAGDRPDLAGGPPAELDLDYFRAVDRLAARLDALEAGSAPVPPAHRGTPGLAELLAEARARRCVVLWCRAARLARSSGLAPGRPPVGPDGVDDVQRALLSLLASGLSTRDCATVLSLQVRAVEYRVRALFEQTATSSRAQLVREYVSGRVVDPGL
jgi:DNA-binding CsgD family transcriptional regulator